MYEIPCIDYRLYRAGASHNNIHEIAGKQSIGSQLLQAYDDRIVDPFKLKTTLITLITKLVTVQCFSRRAVFYSSHI